MPRSSWKFLKYPIKLGELRQFSCFLEITVFAWFCVYACILNLLIVCLSPSVPYTLI